MYYFFSEINTGSGFFEFLPPAFLGVVLQNRSNKNISSARLVATTLRSLYRYLNNGTAFQKQSNKMKATTHHHFNSTRIHVSKKENKVAIATTLITTKGESTGNHAVPTTSSNEQTSGASTNTENATQPPGTRLVDHHGLSTTKSSTISSENVTSNQELHHTTTASPNANEEQIEQEQPKLVYFSGKHDTTWDLNFEKLVQYKSVHKNCLVPQTYAHDLPLGRWVHQQRIKLHQGILPLRRKEKLNSIGFTWSHSKETWLTMYDRLVDYKAENGHCLVPRIYKVDPKLGKWVNNQRHRRHKITSERQQMLTHLGFSWVVAHKSRGRPRKVKKDTPQKAASATSRPTSAAADGGGTILISSSQEPKNQLKTEISQHQDHEAACSSLSIILTGSTSLTNTILPHHSMRNLSNGYIASADINGSNKNGGSSGYNISHYSQPHHHRGGHHHHDTTNSGKEKHDSSSSGTFQVLQPYLEEDPSSSSVCGLFARDIHAFNPVDQQETDYTTSCNSFLWTTSSSSLTPANNKNATSITNEDYLHPGIPSLDNRTNEEI